MLAERMVDAVASRQPEVLVRLAEAGLLRLRLLGAPGEESLARLMAHAGRYRRVRGRTRQVGGWGA